MAYVRRRGNQVAIVQGVRDPQTKKVQQEVLFTFYSQAEALEALAGRGASPAARFQSLLSHRYRDVEFDWPEIARGIRENVSHLPETYDYREARLKGRFGEDLAHFAKQLMFADPQELDSSAWVIDQQREELVFLRELIEWRLEAPPAKGGEHSGDNKFFWRFATQRGVPPEIEEMACDLYDQREMSRARGAFKLLTATFPDYADGHNYLGLIALDDGRLADAQKHFEATVELGRKLLPKRVPKQSWWRDHATRPYIRGLRNLTLTLVQTGEYDTALALCDRLETECQESDAAAAHRAAIYLNLGNWQKARAAGLRVHQAAPAESLLTAFAAYELGGTVEARVLFLHALLNAPRTVAMVLGATMPEPSKTSRDQVSDHNGGIVFCRSIRGYLARQRREAKRFFLALWKDETSMALRATLDDAVRRWEANRTVTDEQAFQVMTRMRTFAFALETLGTPDLKTRAPRRRSVH